jgi:hypothetical protein
LIGIVSKAVRLASGVWLALCVQRLKAAESNTTADETPIRQNPGFDRAQRLKWWSFQPIVRPTLPTIRDESLSSRVRNPIDTFIFSQLERKGLSPSPEADRRTLIRRLYFDLIGLPPSPDRVDAFVGDQDPLAYEKLVEELLASQSYGERWARHWLDVVHFGETHGYDKDKPRLNAWPYRDYVIRALNGDKPYSRFVEEQLAGDALYPDTEDGITALGFIAAGPWDLIGHEEVPETKTDGQIARMMDRDDMVSNAMNSFCSLTIQCARCHNHKFDPISMEDYYRTTAVFAALDRAEKRYDPTPNLARRRRDLESRRGDCEQELEKLRQKITAAGGNRLRLVNLAFRELDAKTPPANRPEFGWHSQIEATADKVKWVQIDLGSPASIDHVTYVGCHDDFNNLGDGFVFPVRFKIEVSNSQDFTSEVQVIEDHTRADFPNPGILPQTTSSPSGSFRYIRFTATRLASRQNDFAAAIAEIMVFNRAGRNLALGAPVTASDSIEQPSRWARQNLTDGAYPGYVTSKAYPTREVLSVERAELLSAVDSQLVQEEALSAKHLEQIRTELSALPPPKIVYAGTIHTGSGAFRGTGGDGGKPRVIRVLNRGDIRKPGQEVGPGTIPLFDGSPETFELPADHPESSRRIALARWVVDSNNPLTWRSIVNRVWQYHFGKALVDSPNDFGHMGRKPSHPELLDWLAADFRDGRQSLKDLHRLIVTSSTYRQTSAQNSKAEAIDAENQLLWRQNRRKLEAEAIRDSLLDVSGLLIPTVGGPSFQDFVVERPEHSPHYEYQLHDPEDSRTHRRSVYRFLVRSQPHPFMSALDCADPSMSVERRNETLNSLQALALLNDKVCVSAARHLAERVQRLEMSLPTQVTTAFRLALGRKPGRDESSELEKYAAEFGMPNACRLILNLNEFAFVD